MERSFSGIRFAAFAGRCVGGWELWRLAMDMDTQDACTMGPGCFVLFVLVMLVHGCEGGGEGAGSGANTKPGTILYTS